MELKKVVAYNFKRRFVEPIRMGLGQPFRVEVDPGFMRAKRQTIRADRKRHARAGEELQLYHGMRTRQCFLIGRATCTDVRGIHIQVGLGIVSIDDYPAIRDDIDGFANDDGFADWAEMRGFWRVEHPGVNNFRGVLIKWKPL